MLLTESAMLKKVSLPRYSSKFSFSFAFQCSSGNLFSNVKNDTPIWAIKRMPESHCKSDRRRRHRLASSRKFFMYATWNILTASHIQKHIVGDRDSRERGRGTDGNFRTPTCIACLVGARKGRGRKFRLRAHTALTWQGHICLTTQSSYKQPVL